MGYRKSIRFGSDLANDINGYLEVVNSGLAGNEGLEASLAYRSTSPGKAYRLLPRNLASMKKKGPLESGKVEQSRYNQTGRQPFDINSTMELAECFTLDVQLMERTTSNKGHQTIVRRR